MLPIRTFLGSLLVWVLAAGCSTSTTYRRPASPVEAAWIVDQPGKREVDLVIASPSGPIASRGVMAPFDARNYVFVDRAGQSLVIPFEHTQSITYKSRAAGAGYGFLYGAIPGFLAGFFSGLLLEKAMCGMDGEGGQHDCGSGIGPGMAIGTIGGLLTGGIGAAIGAAVGKDTTIRF